MSGMNEMGTYIKLSNKFYLNKKIQKFAAEHYRAAFLWINALTYCGDRMTDGFIEEFEASHFLNIPQDDLESLVNAGLLDRVEGGYMIHDYSKSQTLRSDIEHRRAVRSAAGRLGGKRSAKVRAQARVQANASPHAQSDDISHDKANDEADDEANSNQNKEYRIKNIEYKKENIKRKVQANFELERDEAEYERSTSLTTFSQPTYEQFTTLTQQLKAIYPAERFDLETSRNQTMLEIYWFRVEGHAQRVGASSALDWLVAQTKAYVAATERRYVAKFSKFFMEESYARSWKDAVKPLSKSEENFMQNVAYVRRLEELERQGKDPFVKEVAAC